MLFWLHSDDTGPKSFQKQIDSKVDAGKSIQRGIVLPTCPVMSEVGCPSGVVRICNATERCATAADA